MVGKLVTVRPSKNTFHPIEAGITAELNIMQRDMHPCLVGFCDTGHVHFNPFALLKTLKDGLNARGFCSIECHWAAKQRTQLELQRLFVLLRQIIVIQRDEDSLKLLLKTRCSIHLV